MPFDFPAYNKRKRAELKAAGKCISCGKHKPRSGKSTCAPCAEIMKRYYDANREKRGEQSQATYNERKSAGKCTQCAKRKPRRGRVTCSPCFKVVRTAKTKRRDKRYVEHVFKHNLVCSAQKKGRVTITLQEVEALAAKGCALTGRPFDKTSGSHDALSFDRIDNANRMYESGNVRCIAKWVNLLRHTLEDDDLARVVLAYHDPVVARTGPIGKPALRRVNGARKRAKQRGIECTIDRAWAERTWTGRCALTGIAFDRSYNPGQSGAKPLSASLDRIDNTKGYTPDNVRWILSCVNIGKNDMPEREFKKRMKTLLPWAKRQGITKGSDAYWIGRSRVDDDDSRRVADNKRGGRYRRYRWANDPDHREARARYRRNRWSDPVRRAADLAVQREWRRKRYANDPEFRAALLERNRSRRANNPEFRAAQNERARQRRAALAQEREASAAP